MLDPATSTYKVVILWENLFILQLHTCGGMPPYGIAGVMLQAVLQHSLSANSIGPWCR